MSKYTTEVRFICEQKAGLTESVGANSVDNVIESAWNKIFTTKVEFFNESYRKFLCKKILKHYYLREICCETVGIWLLWMNTKLEEIMPYYNQLYKSAELEFNPFYDVDLTRTITGAETGKDSVNNIGSGSNTDVTYYSDTPQGRLEDIDAGRYLTNYTREVNSYENSGNTTSNANKDYNSLDVLRGKNGGKSYSSLLKEYRETFLNIDMMVIEEFSELFFGLW